MAKEIYFWPIHISCNQYLKNAIYAPYVRDFTQDGVGISPSDTSVHKYQDGIFGERLLERIGNYVIMIKTFYSV